MALVVVGIDHRSSSADVFGRVSVGSDNIEHVLDRAIKSDHVSEAVVLATCLRTEIYVDAIRFHGAVADLRGLFSEISGMAVDDLSHHLVERFEESACTHLFSLAAGIESVMVGEGEILGQLSKAWQLAKSRGAAKSLMNGLFRHALMTGKRARNETLVGAGISSLGTAAVAVAADVAGDLKGKSVLVVGAGDVATKVALAARRAGVQRLSITNRSHEKAAELARRVDADVTSLEAGVSAHDIVVTAVGAPDAVIDAQQVSAGHTVFIDLGVPENVRSEVSELPGVEVRKLADVEQFVNQHRDVRVSEVDDVRAIVSEEVLRYFADANARVVGPLVHSLHARTADVRAGEMHRYRARLSGFDQSQLDLVDEITAAVVAKILHGPTVALKSSAGTPDGERMAESLRKLFDL